MPILIVRCSMPPSGFSTYTLVSEPCGAFPIAAAGMSNTVFAWAKTMKTCAVI